MLDGLVMFGNAVVGYLNPLSLTLAFGATLLGVVAGCMPGLSATLVITLLTTLTLKMQPNQAILVLVCAYNGAIYGGSRTAILLNIPGTAANAAACLDGYQLAHLWRTEHGTHAAPATEVQHPVTLSAVFGTGILVLQRLIDVGKYDQSLPLNGYRRPN